MCKNTNIIIRVSEEEKKKAAKLVDVLGEKNISSMFRDYINSLYSLYLGETSSTNLDYHISLLKKKKAVSTDHLEIFKLDNQILECTKIKDYLERLDKLTHEL